MSDSAVAARGARTVRRRLPIGVEPIGDDHVHVRVWAPLADAVDVVLAGRAGGTQSMALIRESGGYFSDVVAGRAGDRYRFRLDGGDRLYPDPASRFQPEGPHGPSEIVDASAFRWTDAGWRGARMDDQIVYELHVGTFTHDGTWEAAARQLPELARIGITMIEVMPVAEFDGRFGWGYDGVDLFAPSHTYGGPDDFRRFVDSAHKVGVAVILDVVYNHFGPSGNYLAAFSKAYFSSRYDNEWGDAINFDGEDAAPVREFFTSNARYWIGEFHLDGLRLDATQQIFDQSGEHVLAAIGRAAREAAGSRPIVLIAENEPQDTRLVRPLDAGGYGLDGLWNDDFHHSAIVALTGRSEAYYSDTTGTSQELISAAKYGYLFQGQLYEWQRQSRGTPSWDLPASTFVAFLQNHDQVANSARGSRIHTLTSPGRYRAMTALLLLGPWTPMLFQGQEFAASAPFLYFADFDGDLLAGVRKGRAEFLQQFPSVAAFEQQDALADPGDRRTFERCGLDFGERGTHAPAYRLHADLLSLRRSDAAFSNARRGPGNFDGSVLTGDAFVLRFFTRDHADDRLLIVNLGGDLWRRSIADPLVAPPLDADWTIRWSSEHPSYGGGGVADLWPKGRWLIPGESATVLAPGPRRERRASPRIRRTA
jgi:maltooligosyltrehalose trehalohydrolase